MYDGVALFSTVLNIQGESTILKTCGRQIYISFDILLITIIFFNIIFNHYEITAVFSSENILRNKLSFPQFFYYLALSEFVFEFF